MAANHTNQGLTNADIWALQQLIIKANDIQLDVIITMLENEIRLRKLLKEAWQ